MTGDPKAVDPRSYWDGQLKFSDILPQFQAYLARMAQDSALFAQGRAFSRIATGDDPRQWVEWTTAGGVENIVPVIVHGGYWRALRAEDHRFLMPALSCIGGAVASIEYRLKPHHPMAACIHDTIAGLRALRQVFAQARFLLVGHSAGAHLALHAAEDPSCRASVAGVIALSGVYDLAPVAASSLQAEINLTPEEIARYTLAASSTRPPTVYVNGADETHELVRASALMAAHGRARALWLPDANHMTLTWAAAAHMSRILAFWRAL